MKTYFKIGITFAVCLMYNAYTFNSTAFDNYKLPSKRVEQVQKDKENKAVLNSKPVRAAQALAAGAVTGLCCLYVAGAIGICPKTAESAHPDFNMRRLAASAVFIYTGIEAGTFSYTTLMTLIGKKP